jgi:hypothetical protein
MAFENDLSLLKLRRDDCCTTSRAPADSWEMAQLIRRRGLISFGRGVSLPDLSVSVESRCMTCLRWRYYDIKTMAIFVS